MLLDSASMASSRSRKCLLVLTTLLALIGVASTASAERFRYDRPVDTPRPHRETTADLPRGDLFQWKLSNYRLMAMMDGGAARSSAQLDVAKAFSLRFLERDGSVSLDDKARIAAAIDVEFEKVRPWVVKLAAGASKSFDEPVEVRRPEALRDESKATSSPTTPPPKPPSRSATAHGSALAKALSPSSEAAVPRFESPVWWNDVTDDVKREFAKQYFAEADPVARAGMLRSPKPPPLRVQIAIVREEPSLPKPSQVPAPKPSTPSSEAPALRVDNGEWKNALHRYEFTGNSAHAVGGRAAQAAAARREPIPAADPSPDDHSRGATMLRQVLEAARETSTVPAPTDSGEWKNPIPSVEFTGTSDPAKAGRAVSAASQRQAAFNPPRAPHHASAKGKAAGAVQRIQTQTAALARAAAIHAASATAHR